jgi:hypothetical protein
MITLPVDGKEETQFSDLLDDGGNPVEATGKIAAFAANLRGSALPSTCLISLPVLR